MSLCKLEKTLLLTGQIGKQDFLAVHFCVLHKLFNTTTHGGHANIFKYSLDNVMHNIYLQTIISVS